MMLMLRCHMLSQGCIGGEGALGLGVTQAACPGGYALQSAVQIAAGMGLSLGLGCTRHWGVIHKDAAAPLWVVPQLA